MFKGFFNRMIYGRSDKPDLMPEDMAQNKFQLFFEILGVRFWDLVKLNLILLVFMIPLFIWTMMNLGVLNQEGLELAVKMQYTYQYFIGLIPCLIILGPGLAGINYVVRKYASDEHAWVWSDFKDSVKANWKQALLYMLIFGVAILLGFMAWIFYNQMAAQNFLIYVMRGLFIFFFVLFLMSSMYVFPMMVTYKLKLRYIIKNSIIFTISRLHFTIIFTILVLLPAVLLIALYMVWAYAIIGLLLFYGLFGFAFASYILNAYTHTTFEKYMKVEEELPVAENDTVE